jgi:hypothetical protein
MEMEQLSMFPAELTSLSEELPAKDSVSQESREDCRMTAPSSALPFASFLQTCNPGGSFGKMYRVSLAPEGEKISKPSSEKLMKSGIAVGGECLTLNTPEWTVSLVPFLNEDGVCSLSDILEMSGNIPQKYYLSQLACLGILRRAASRGKDLPEMLKDALEMQAQSGCEPDVTGVAKEH